MRSRARCGTVPLMTRFITLVAGLLACASLPAQVLKLSPEELAKFTPKNTFERFADGRPKVPDSLIDQVRELSAEDCWGVLRRHEYVNQFENGWKVLNEGRKLAGRAVTAMYMPYRPTLDEVVTAGIRDAGFPNRGHQYVIDMLQPGDVLVADGYGTLPGFVGDNLATYIMVATKTGGLVVDGGIRDLEGIHGMDTQIYYRFADPRAVMNFTLVGINVPVRIGQTTVMPGDIVLGDREGTTFIPPHLAEEMVKGRIEIMIHDEWTKMKLKTGQYKSHRVYGRPREPELIKEYEEYKAKRLRELGLSR